MKPISVCKSTVCITTKQVSTAMQRKEEVRKRTVSEEVRCTFETGIDRFVLKVHCFRKHALKCIAYSRDHIVRTYPGGMRIDSSNFNPIQYWAFGLQMVALNFQTPDVAMAINAAMFEQSGNCGYILKPRALWDDTHPLYRRFNPLSKDLASHSALILTLTVRTHALNFLKSSLTTTRKHKFDVWLHVRW